MTITGLEFSSLDFMPWKLIFLKAIGKSFCNLQDQMGGDIPTLAKEDLRAWFQPLPKPRGGLGKTLGFLRNAHV